MKKKNLFYIGLLCCIMYACKKNPEYPWQTEPHFSFMEQTSVVEVTESTEFFYLKGYAKEPSEYSYSQALVIVPEKTTAVESQHYIMPEYLAIQIPANTTTTQQVKITLLPENISEPLDISFTTFFKWSGIDYSDLIDTTTVRLIPAGMQP